tara:strand:+ start:371 stop:1009 length:639 start_codon:yes stop_codon:yes gene_type:complete
MSDCLPVIIDTDISETPEEDEKFVESGDNVSDNEKEDKEEEEEVVEVKERVKIDTNVIFQGAPSVKPVAKKKRVMDDAKLEQLKKAREKGNATRTANRLKKEQLKKEHEEETQQKIQAKTDEYVEKKVSKIKQQVDKDPVIVQNSSVSIEDIEKIVGGAIGKYETERVARKVVKKEKKEKEEKHAKIHATIKRAQGKALNPTEEGFFDNCFG